MKLINKTLYIFSLNKINILFFNHYPNSDELYKSNELEVLILQDEILLCALLQYQTWRQQTSFDYFICGTEDQQTLTKENFIINSISLYKRNVINSNSKSKKYKWKELL